MKLGELHMIETWVSRPTKSFRKPCEVYVVKDESNIVRIYLHRELGQPRQAHCNRKKLYSEIAKTQHLPHLNTPQVSFLLTLLFKINLFTEGGAQLISTT